MVPQKETVFPAWAGLYRGLLEKMSVHWSIPRMGGAVSGIPSSAVQRFWYSPHGRGCIQPHGSAAKGCRVFPAWAGLYRVSEIRETASSCIPRMGGVVSRQGIERIPTIQDSPHVRGCIVRAHLQTPEPSGFPAWAGLYLRMPSVVRSRLGIPACAGVYPPSACMTC